MMTRPIKKIFFYSIGLLLLFVIGYLTGQNSSSSRVQNGKWYKATTENKITVSFHNTKDEFTITLNDDGTDKLLGYISDGILEVSYVSEDPNNITTVCDKDGDGVPEYRLIQNRKTYEVVKEYFNNPTWDPKIDQTDVP